MVKKMTALLILSIMMSGCMNNQAQQPGTQAQQPGAQTQQAMDQPGVNLDNRIQIANQAAEKIAKVNGVRQANVLVTKRNAYVAAVVNTNQGKLTPELEGQIAKQVRATDPNIQNVYVSTNPEFVDRINTYVTDVGQGKPVAGFFEEFNTMVQRMFPTLR
ncbi:YhcN/YlaJ family sporulation lipoprotein [Brevibacillus nitrificans]|uniref:YhcN/YlaJ family sporulation lipoprotein n=1 Tax=Brevibacillus nitrificans TaxID=651560 RepID=UPI00285600B6|nr:YhcN/YlaJ family sporulation lipoprotein [Brevibacillus nitrificans]MDR7316793.1 YhcN/YlaJ family sporulation lipoprotein [Brevibacillus nitrificans]